METLKGKRGKRETVKNGGKMGHKIWKKKEGILRKLKGNGKIEMVRGKKGKLRWIEENVDAEVKEKNKKTSKLEKFETRRRKRSGKLKW